MIRVVQRALAVLECFDSRRPRLPLNEISQRINLPKSTTFRILSTLIGEGYLIQHDSQEYSLSLKLMQLASVAQHSLGLRDIVHPFLERLAQATGETVEISRLDGDARICVDVVESSSSLKSIVAPGSRLPLLFGATGKVFLSRMGWERVLELVKAGDRASEVDLDLLARQLKEIRSQGFSLTKDERVVGAAAIAVPLWMHAKEGTYCLTVAGPSARFGGREEQMCSLMVAEGRAISILLGGQVGVEPPL